MMAATHIFIKYLGIFYLSVTLTGPGWGEYSSEEGGHSVCEIISKNRPTVLLVGCLPCEAENAACPAGSALQPAALLFKALCFRLIISCSCCLL